MDKKILANIIRELELNPLERTGHLYHPVPFPEFSHLKVSSNLKEVNKKWKKIQHVSNQILGNNWQEAKVLDIGANAGFHTFQCVQQGAKVTAFEPHPGYSKIAKGIIISKNFEDQISWINDKYNWNTPLPYSHYDLGLLLSTYQWMAEGGKNFAYATSALEDISKKVKYLFFELGFNRGKSHIKTKKLNHYAHLIQHLRQHTAYRFFKLLTKTKLWKNNTRYLVLCSNDPFWQDTGFQKLMANLHI